MSGRPLSQPWLALLVFAVGCAPVADPPTASESTTALKATTTTTAPPTGRNTSTSAITVEDPGSILIFGDWGSGTDDQEAVAAAMAESAEKNALGAILTTGDNFYSDDAEFLIEPYGWAVDQGIPFWIAWGNHDVESPRRIELVSETFDSPPRWGIYEWGDVDVIVLDSTQVGSEEQQSFLQSALEDSGDPAIVVFHHPAYSCGSYSGLAEVVENWTTIFDREVFLVLSGHDHNYQRFEVGGVTYVVTGGGGARIYELMDCPTGHPERLAGAAQHHFMALDMGDGTIEAIVLDVNGEEIDRFSVALP